MNWTDMTRDWGRALRHLKRRFPHIDETALSSPPIPPEAMAEHLARQHDLTDLEAEEELKDWIYIQSLARQATEMDAH
ncbi:hypothetical protein [Phaeobacter sp. J2-8]|uniref:hypothetical protein n=1 Tax=Phaeobacter sp. J2-8 TaxID=2931394 RepID=UPI001FD1F2B3|nr:hypothetical protein [Phaeobacter sp. J2-8]MCJ7871968.1 hypothetical protein [Phaeobacter sp. J2-8]